MANSTSNKPNPSRRLPQNHTAGPWAWRKFGDGLALSTDGRGCIIVMDFVRKGMNRAQARFGVNRDDADKGGLMQPADDLDLEAHPDARLIAAAPDLLAALRMTTKCLIDLAPYGPDVVVGAVAIVEAALAVIAKAEGKS